MLLKRLVITYILIIVVALLVIGILVFNTINNTIRQQFIYSNELVLNNGVDLFSKFIKDNKDILLDVAIDQVVQKKLDKFSNGDKNVSDLEGYVTSQSNYRNALSKNAAHIEILPYDGQDVYKYNSEKNAYTKMELSPWMQLTVKKNGAFLMQNAEIGDKSYIRLSMVVSSIEYWHRHTAIAAVYINTDVMLSLFYNIKLENSQIPYLVDDMGNIIIPYNDYRCLEKADLLSKKDDWWMRNKYFIINKPMSRTDWKLMGILPENEFMSKSNKILNTFLIAGSIVVLFLMVVSIYISYWITNPIRILSKEMLNVEQNKFRELPIGKRYPDETKQLYKQFNYMVKRINNLIQEVYLAQIKEKEAELLALQQQINPHFLYNTLDSISWMAMAYKAEDIRHMVMSLASMMRYSLNEGDNFISVRDELEQVRNYLVIQEIRYDNKFTTSIKADMDVLDYNIIKLIIQPLVENAIIHGFKEQGEFGHIDIVIKRKSNYLAIRVINDGDEIDFEKVKKLLNPDTNERPKHYGLRNVNDRLIKRFGKESGLKFYIENERTVAEILIPINLLSRGEHNEKD